MIGPALSFPMHEVRCDHVIPSVPPSKSTKKGVRGPAAIDDDGIDRFLDDFDMFVHIAQCTTCKRVCQASRMEWISKMS